MTIYRYVYELPGGKLDAVDFAAETVNAAMAARGCPLDPSRVGESHLREELRGRPVFKNVCGPMWGGIENGQVVVRYESWPAYERLSR